MECFKQTVIRIKVSFENYKFPGERLKYYLKLLCLGGRVITHRGCALTVSGSGAVMEDFKRRKITVSAKYIAKLYAQNTILTASLTNLTAPLPQSRDSNSYVSRPILTPITLW
jgi:hypothetical protein